jgi:potassium-dependent mechanosensitive channel
MPLRRIALVLALLLAAVDPGGLREALAQAGTAPAAPGAPKPAAQGAAPAAPAAEPGGQAPANGAPSNQAPANQAPAAQAPAQAPPQAAPPAVSTATKAVRARLDADKLDLDQREAALQRRDLTSSDLARLRDGIDPIADRLRGIIADLSPGLDAARARLEQLGPKPKEGQPAESADVLRERGEREAAVAEIDETQRLARGLLLQTDQLTDQISARRRSAFTRALFERNASLVSPELWSRVAADVPRDLRAIRFAFDDAVSRFGSNATGPRLAILGLALGVSLALYFGRRNIAPRLGHREAGVNDPPQRRKLMAAWRVVLLGTVPAVLGSYVVYAALDATGLLPARLASVANAILVGLAFVAFVEAVTDGLLAPGKPNWRVVAMSDLSATRATAMAVGLAAVVSVAKVVDALNTSIAAALPVTIVTRGVFAVAAALVLAEGLRRFAVTETSEEACLGPYIPTDAGGGIGGPARMVGWIAVAAVVLSSLGGYVAFSAFLVDQLVWVATVAGVLALAAVSADAFIGGTLKDDTRLATALQANTGLRRSSLNQIAVLGTGLVRAMLYAAAALLVLAPWGLDSTDLFSSIRAAFFGFRVGEVTISFSTIALAVAIFAGGFLITRAVQRWLENTFLPATELDAGLRNSISTVAGYFGFIVAIAAAFSYLGLSLDKIAIVAGALSVGIGFGLQSIINNFVSGLILLWERPIRVGDLVVVSDNEGYVRRISVRATEIQTFDRSTTIIPNSNLISGVVKNRVRGDRTGRVIIAVSVPRNQDPHHAAEVIAGCARAHPDVMREPPPRVQFKKIADASLDFELFAFVPDVNLQASVQSDLNYAIFRALSDGGLFNVPAAASAINVQGLEPVHSALGQIASALGREPGGGAEPAAALPGDGPDRTRDDAVRDDEAPRRRAPARAT